jgi:uncharacterized protein (DUF305 family)
MSATESTKSAEPQADDAEPEDVEVSTSRWRGILVISAAAVAVLLVGAAIGMLITLSAVQEPRPEADSVDVGFAQDMSTHHYQAVSMASWTRDHTADPTIQQLALDIEATQTGQIGRMTGWLQLWGQPELPETTQRMKWMAGSGHAGHTGGGTLMPGMASQEEMTKLRSLSGRELDVYFLQLMLRHHEGGLPMARYAAEHASQSAVRGLAKHMDAGQQGEIKTMTMMLAERGAAPMPAH